MLSPLQELRGEAWVFDDDAITFVNSELIGGPADLLKWAAEVHQYDDFRSAALYQTLAEQEYKNYINANMVSAEILFTSRLLQEDRFCNGSLLPVVKPL